jgi:hypothetical protein
VYGYRSQYKTVKEVFSKYYSSNCNRRSYYFFLLSIKMDVVFRYQHYVASNRKGLKV